MYLDLYISPSDPTRKLHFNRPWIPKHLSDRDLRCGRKPDVHRVGNLKLINLDQRLPFSVEETYGKSSSLGNCSVFWWCYPLSRSWFGDECWSCAVNWNFLFRSYDFHAVQPRLGMCHGMSFLWISMIFSIPAWFWPNTRGSIQMRRTRTTTTSRYRLATDVSLEFFSATVPSWAKFPGALSQEYDPLELEELWEGCFLVVALEGWIK